jgi:hypothetical protein
MRHKPKPAAATLAPEPSALEEPTPKEPAPEADTTLPDLPPLLLKVGPDRKWLGAKPTQSVYRAS